MKFSFLLLGLLVFSLFPVVKYNEWTGKNENVPESWILRYNPEERIFIYADKNAELVFNKDLGKWEFDNDFTFEVIENDEDIFKEESETNINLEFDKVD